MSQFIKSEMIEDYNKELSQLAESLTELEKVTVILGVNALKSLSMLEKATGQLSNQQLINFAKETSIAHLYIADSSGAFVRSTNGPINANIFSYCDKYRDLIYGNADIFVTPIVPSSDEPTQGFYKYIMIPNSDRSKVFEASISFNSIGKFLQSLLNSNKDIIDVSFYTPTGVLLGSVSSGHISKNNTAKNSIQLTKLFKNDSNNCCECKMKKIADAENTYYYKLIATISMEKINNTLKYFSISLLLFYLLFTFVSILISRLLTNYLVARVNQLHQKISGLLDYDTEQSNINMHGNDEISDVANQFDKLLNKLNDNKKQLISVEKDRAIANLAAQVAHDIRSPLAIIDLIIKDLKGIAEEHRVLIRNAANRIYHIANNLLSSYRSKFNKPVKHIHSIASPELLIDLILSVISEKRILCRNKSIDFTITCNEASNVAFVNVSSTEFKRVFSNLLDNALEALESKNTGTINVNLLAQDNLIQLIICDDGCGMTDDLLREVLTGSGISNKRYGNGLGLPHAIKMIEQEWGGQLKMESNLNKGTKIDITLKCVSAPEWFADELYIFSNETIIIFDDDETVQHSWRQRLKVASLKIKVISFNNIDDFISYCSNQPINLYRFLINHSVIGSQLSGLDIIKKLNIVQKSYLVTSNYNDICTKTECCRLGIKIIPKRFVAYIPIRMVNKGDCPDLIIVDDDEALTNAWVLYGKSVGVQVAAFNNIDEFRYAISMYSKDTPIYIDFDLNDKISGEIFSKELHDLGFNNLYLISGYPSSHFKNMSWVKKILDKSPPF